jgi:hypothetical protein
VVYTHDRRNLVVDLDNGNRYVYSHVYLTMESPGLKIRVEEGMHLDTVVFNPQAPRDVRMLRDAVLD